MIKISLKMSKTEEKSHCSDVAKFMTTNNLCEQSDLAECVQRILGDIGSLSIRKCIKNLSRKNPRICHVGSKCLAPAEGAIFRAQ